MYDSVQEDLNRFEEEIDHTYPELPDVALETPVSELQMRNIRLTIRPETTIGQVVDTMVENNVGCLPVVDEEGRLIGIVTERDILLKAAPDFDAFAQKPTSEIMVNNPTTAHSDDTIGTAIRRMHDGHYRHLPIVDDERRALAVISVRNIMEFVVEHFPVEVLNLPPQPIDRRPMRAPEGA
ncbi:MAG: CBS domain-containing protein [Candidatus Poribacteria bacterium]|nr:CBS domain-containing protein [Candidatus Poribacteria bacterium]